MKTRPFGEATTPRHIAAETIARRRNRDHIAPNDWTEAGAILTALKQGGYKVTRTPTVS